MLIRHDNADGMSELFDHFQSQSMQQSQWSQNEQLSDKDDVDIDYGWGMTSDGGLVTSDTEVVTSDTEVVPSDRGMVTNDGEVVTSDGGLVTSDTEVVTSDRGVVTSDGGIVTGDNMTSSDDERSDNGDIKMMDTQEKEHPREEGELSDTGSPENDVINGHVTVT